MDVGGCEYVVSFGNIGKMEDAVVLNPDAGELLLRVSKEQCDLSVIDHVAVFGEERAGDFVEPAEGYGEVDAVCLLTGFHFEDGGVPLLKDVARVYGQ